ncbi:hypothetical protein A0256_12750 [Mucilaginibacter sp. PAMC 26640]|nr:hypothetical protein A0256_12750 [Mucilaginibacter sp. PAMC 26640]
MLKIYLCKTPSKPFAVPQICSSVCSSSSKGQKLEWIAVSIFIPDFAAITLFLPAYESFYI